MATELRKGQKCDITKINPNFNQLTVEIGWTAEQNFDIDAAAFMLTASGKVKNDEDFIFYNNPQHATNSISHEVIDNNHEKININLAKIPSDIEKIAFTLTINDADKLKQKFADINEVYIQAVSSSNVIFRYNLDKFSVETAIVIGEIYRYKGQWKFNSIGAGFSGGLAALCNNFGIEVSDTTPTPKTTSTPSTEEPLSLKKVELKKGQKISLVKTGKTLGEIIINLNWSQPSAPKKPSGLFDRIFGSSKSSGIDLDLACLYELKNGNKGVVQALGNCFGNLNNPPYIALDGDDRTGSVAAGETIRVNGKYVDQIKRILVFTFIYEGVANWRDADGVVTVKCPGSPDIIVKMDEYGSDLPNCGIALLENQGGTFSVEKIVKFYQSTRYLDQDFNWGLRWVAGTKD